MSSVRTDLHTPVPSGHPLLIEGMKSSIGNYCVLCVKPLAPVLPVILNLFQDLKFACHSRPDRVRNGVRPRQSTFGNEKGQKKKFSVPRSEFRVLRIIRSSRRRLSPNSARYRGGIFDHKYSFSSLRAFLTLRLCVKPLAPAP